MPSPPRRRAARRRQYTPEHIRVLLTGHDFFRTFRSDDERRHAWHELKSELLTEWIAEHPGTRPWAWWEFDAPEPCRETACEPILRPDGSDAGLCVDHESERDYLARLGLLTAAERRALGVLK